MKHLFIDDQIVDRIDNLARKLHQPEKFPGNAVVRPERRWENCAIQIRTTPAWDPDEGRFKLIYLAAAEGPDPEVRLGVTGAPAGGESFYCLATSADGVNWEKPELGLYDYQALTWRETPIGTANNILPSAQGMLLGPIRDPREPDPRRRYKGLAYRGGELEPRVSADAIHWENPGLAPLPSADEAHLALDEDRRLFIATVKHGGPYGRSFYLTTSDDFETWSEQELVFHADQVDQENGWERLRVFLENPAYLRPVYYHPEDYRTDVYNFPVFPYEGLYLALPVMHHWAGKHPPMFENVDSRKSVELAASRDLRHWQRVAGRAPFLEHSPVGDGSAYDTGQIVTTNGPVVRNNELWFYYVGLKHRSQSIAATVNREYLDAGAVCMARLRLDGFVSLKGGIEWGSVLTRPLMIEGRELRANVDAWRGQVRAELVDPGDGRPLPGYTRDECVPAVVDSTDEPLRWRGKADLAELSHRTVRIRFSILRGELYSFWFAGD
jgi:hypothetical protein